MGRLRWFLISIFLLVMASCDDTDSKDNEEIDDRVCEGASILVTEQSCGVDDLGELTEVCLDGKWEQHSCNHPADWPNHIYTSGYITGCSGQIHFQKWEQKESPKANLVLLNGRAEYVDKYHHLIPLITRQWNIISFDHYGQGRSDGIRAHAVDFDANQVCDFGKILDATANPAIPTIVLAHSMGGYIATRYEELYPGEIKGFALTSPMFGMVTDPFTNAQAVNMAQLAVDDGRGEEHSFENYIRTECDEWKITHDCKHYDKYRDDYLTLIGYPTYGWFLAAMTGVEQAINDAEKILAPTTIFQAGYDNSVLFEPMEEFCDSLKACELFKRPDDYHDLLTELDREEIVGQILEFFDGILASN